MHHQFGFTSSEIEDKMNKIILVSPEELGQIIEINIRKVLSESPPHSTNSSSIDDNKPLTVEEAAEFLNLPKATLYQFTSARKIPFKKLGKRIVFSKNDILKWVEQNHRKSHREIENEVQLNLKRL